MRTPALFHLGGAMAVATFLAAGALLLTSLQATGQTVAVDGDDITGVVTSSTGPEVGVWVIAETTDLPTKFNKTVVTNDQGRYLIPIFLLQITRCGCAATGSWIRPRFRQGPAECWT